MAGRESFELSIEVLQAFEFKRFRVKMILCDRIFIEVSVTDFYRHDDISVLICSSMSDLAI